jgi:type IV pilus assembly protein PilQ
MVTLRNLRNFRNILFIFTGIAWNFSFAITTAPVQVTRQPRIVPLESLSNKSSEQAPTMPGQLMKIMEEELKRPTMTIDFVDTDIREVVRSISLAYGLSIITDRDVTNRITVHMNDVDVVDGLEAICAANGFELLREGAIYRIRKASEQTKNILRMNFQRMDLSIENQEIRSFVKDFAAKTGLRILASQDLEGSVSGSWKNQIPMEGFKALMDAHGYRIRKRNGFYIVYGQNNQASARRRRGGQGHMDINIEHGIANFILEDADLADVLRTIAEQAGLNMVFYGDIRENINAYLQNATIDEAFQTILKGSRYSYLITEEGTVLVGDKNPQTPAGKILTGYELYPLKHLQAEQVAQLLPKSIGQPGLLTVIKEQNAVLITGTADEIESVKRYLTLVDIPTPQVLLEVVIVEFRRGDESGFGLSSGPQSAGMKRTGSGMPRVNAEFSHDAYQWDFRKNGFQTAMGFLPDRFEFELSAMEKNNKARILARPTITTLNGNKASIQVTNTMYYPIQSVSKDGLPINDFRPINDGITVEITPYVTHGGGITVAIRPEIKTTSLSAAANGPRDINSRDLNTTVKLQNGQTIQLGGLIQANNEKVREFIPLLGSIPLLGYLFSYSKVVENTTELVIYVTPHLVESVNAHIDYRREIDRMDARPSRLNLDRDFTLPETMLKQINPDDTTSTINLVPIGNMPQRSLKQIEPQTDMEDWTPQD